MAAADQYRDPAAIAKCARIAAHIFERHQVDFSTAKREGRWSNATWSAGELVPRISVETGAEQDILREARLASALPPEVGYPSIVETGVTEGLEWMLSDSCNLCPLSISYLVDEGLLHRRVGGW